jgi:hypothetical protein
MLSFSSSFWLPLYFGFDIAVNKRLEMELIINIIYIVVNVITVTITLQFSFLATVFNGAASVNPL